MIRTFINSLLSFQHLSFTILFILLLLFYITEFQRVKKLTKLGPPTYPFIGCLISFYKNRFRLLDWYTELLTQSPSNTIVINRLGARRTIVTANHHNVEYILKTNFNNFPKGKPFTEVLGDFLGNGIFNVDGELWLTQRKLASHEFSASSLKEFVIHTLEENVHGGLIPAMEEFVILNKVVDLQELLGRFSFNVICRFTLGMGSNDLCCLDPSVPISSLARAFDVAAEISARRGAAPLFLVWRVKKWLGVGSEKKLREAVKEVRTRVMEIIWERKRKMNVTGKEHVVDVGGEDLLARLISAGGQIFWSRG